MYTVSLAICSYYSVQVVHNDTIPSYSNTVNVTMYTVTLAMYVNSYYINSDMHYTTVYTTSLAII